MVPDPLIDLVRSAARQLIEWALEAELSLSLVQFSNDTTDEGHARLVRHGSLLDRTIMTGLGAIAVKVPRARHLHRNSAALLGPNATGLSSTTISRRRLVGRQ